MVLIDTAGRLHTKVGLMDELGKVKRVIEKHGPVDEVLLVLDATTGQNGLTQARVFTEVVDVTGIVLTKLDGTAKGGIVVAVQRELGVPVKLVGPRRGPGRPGPVRRRATSSTPCSTPDRTRPPRWAPAPDPAPRCSVRVRSASMGPCPRVTQCVGPRDASTRRWPGRCSCAPSCVFPGMPRSTCVG